MYKIYLQYIVITATILFISSITGCGGKWGKSNSSSSPSNPNPRLQHVSISGIIFDEQRRTVNGAKVFLAGNPNQFVITNTAGAYRLNARIQFQGNAPVPEKEVHLNAIFSQNGIEYTGQNLVRDFTGSTADNVNITLSQPNHQASVYGRVYNQHGMPLQRARVYAKADSAMSSSLAVTDSDGRYEIKGLLGGNRYTFYGTGTHFRSTRTQLNLGQGVRQEIDFTLDQPTYHPFAPPQNIRALSWTAPSGVTRSYESTTLYEEIKNRLEPNRPKKKITRESSLGEHIHVELAWDPVQNQNILGHNIYRFAGPGNSNPEKKFLTRDFSSGFYSDHDIILRPNTDYYYRVTTLNTGYPQNLGSEGSQSNAVHAKPLDDMIVTGYDPISRRIHWNITPGAQNYIIMVYRQYPGIRVDPIWENSGDPGSQGQPLIGQSFDVTIVPELNQVQHQGRRYWYIVVGKYQQGSATSYTMSKVLSFIN